MVDDPIKQAAQEFLVAQFTEDGLASEEQQGREAAISLAPALWKSVLQEVSAICLKWNSVTNQQTLSCKETPLGDLRIRCAGRLHQLMFHYDSKRRLIRVENTVRQDYEPRVVLLISAYRTDSGYRARLIRNDEPVNLELLVVGQLRSSPA